MATTESDSQAQVLLADAPSEWQTQLRRALGSDERLLRASTDGEELQSALMADPALYKVIVIGDGLSKIGGLDALYVTAKDPKRPKAPAGRARIVLLISSVRIDLDLLALWRDRGVTGLIHRDDPIDEIAHRIRSSLFVQQRVARRFPVSAEATLELGEHSMRGTLEDFSLGGTCILVPTRKLPVEPSEGAEVTLRCSVAEIEISARCVIRRLDRRKKLLGDRLALGLSFVASDFTTMQGVEAAIKCLSIPLEDVPDPLTSSDWPRMF